jgi:hypothetical protein
MNKAAIVEALGRDEVGAGHDRNELYRAPARIPIRQIS